MIFVTLGSQKFQFNRLLIEIDRLVGMGKITEKVFAQTGYSDYKPKNYEYKEFLNREEYKELITESQIVITHGGTGAIVGSIKQGKKVIAVPRIAAMGEHVDDHQIEIVEEFQKNKMITACYDVKNLITAIEEQKHVTIQPYLSNTEIIIDNIDKFLEELV